MLNQINEIMVDCDPLTRRKVLSLLHQWTRDRKIKPAIDDHKLVQYSTNNIVNQINIGRAPIGVTFDPYARRFKLKTGPRATRVAECSELVGVYTEPSRLLIREDLWETLREHDANLLAKEETNEG